MTTGKYPATFTGLTRASSTTLVDRALAASVALFITSAMLLSETAFSRVPHVIVLFLFAVLLVKSSQQPLRLRLDATLAAGGLFVIYGLSSVLWSVNQGGALASSISLAFDFAGAVLVWVALQNGVSLKLVAWSAVAAATVQGIIGLNQSFVMGLDRAEGLTGNANALAIQLSLAAFLILLAEPRKWWSNLLAVALIVVATLTTGTRKLVFVWFAYVLLLLRSLFPLFRRPSVGAALVLLLAPVAIWVSLTYGPVLGFGEAFEDVTFFQRVGDTVTEGKATGVRSAMIADALEVWWREPAFGHGINQYRHVSSFTTYSHNKYVELLANFGVVGTLFFYALYAVIGYRAIVGIIAGRQYAWVIMATLVVFLLMDVARVSYTDRFTWIHLLVLGLVATGEVGRPEPEPG